MYKLVKLRVSGNFDFAAIRFSLNAIRETSILPGVLYECDGSYYEIYKHSFYYNNFDESKSSYFGVEILAITENDLTLRVNKAIGRFDDKTTKLSKIEFR